MIYAVGDIHGQNAMLRQLLNQLWKQPLVDDDPVVFIGDFVDRGGDSRGVVETLLEFQDRHSNVVFLRGNHEQLMLTSQEEPPPTPGKEPGTVELPENMANWMENGGAATLLSYGVKSLLDWWTYIPDEHWRFLRKTRIEWIYDRYHFVHAGLLPRGKTWDGAAFNLDPRIWIREPFLSSKDNFDNKLVVFGHTPQESGQPLVLKNKLGIDTAAVYGGPLTAAVLDTQASRRPAPPRFIAVPHVQEALREEISVEPRTD
jgi:serine/threonine protein phosphatase 1